MAIKVVVRNVIIALGMSISLVHGYDFLYEIPQNYEQISCTFKRFTRRSGSYSGKKISRPHKPQVAKVCSPHQKFITKNMLHKKSHESVRNFISHPYIPGPKSVPAHDRKKSDETSTNWSGYVMATNLSNPAKNSISGVYGSWIVPTIVPATKNTYSAMWVGIDGYTSGTVEQIGTEHDYINGTKQHSAWFEMFPRASYTIQGFPVRTGDLISAMVEYVGNNTFSMRIINHTQKVVAVIPTRYTKSSKAQRSSAEWIMEAPSANHILPLTNFKTAYFSACRAKINGTLKSLNNTSFPHLSLEMVTNNDIPKATPSLITGNESFSVTWKHQ